MVRNVKIFNKCILLERAITFEDIQRSRDISLVSNLLRNASMISYREKTYRIAVLPGFANIIRVHGKKKVCARS